MLTSRLSTGAPLFPLALALEPTGPPPLARSALAGPGPFPCWAGLRPPLCWVGPGLFVPNRASRWGPLPRPVSHDNWVGSRALRRLARRGPRRGPCGLFSSGSAGLSRRALHLLVLSPSGRTPGSSSSSAGLNRLVWWPAMSPPPRSSPWTFSSRRFSEPRRRRHHPNPASPRCSPCHPPPVRDFQDEPAEASPPRPLRKSPRLACRQVLCILDQAILRKARLLEGSDCPAPSQGPGDPTAPSASTDSNLGRKGASCGIRLDVEDERNFRDFLDSVY